MIVIFTLGVEDKSRKYGQWGSAMILIYTLGDGD